MADFATEFITKLNGKLTPEQMKVVLNELEIFSDDYNIEKKIQPSPIHSLTSLQRAARKRVQCS